MDFKKALVQTFFLGFVIIYIFNFQAAVFGSSGDSALITGYNAYFGALDTISNVFADRIGFTDEESLASYFSQIQDVLDNSFSENMDLLKNAIVSAFVDFFGSVEDFFKDLGDSIVASLKSYFGEFSSFVSSLVSSVRTALETYFGNSYQFFQKLGSSLSTSMQSFFGDAWSRLTTALNDLLEWLNVN